MIDTDKYKGHTPAPWRIVCWERQWYIEGDYEEGQEDCTASDVCHLYGTAQRKDPTARLIADAPLLLEEVKRLREQVKKWEDDWIRMANYISHHDKEMYEAIDEDIGWEDEPIRGSD